MFTIYDGQIVRAGDLVASVKIAPQLVAEAVIQRGEAVARAGGPVVTVAAFRPGRVGVLVKESVHGPARDRFEASVRAKVEGLGSTIVAILYVADDADGGRRQRSAPCAGAGPTLDPHGRGAEHGPVRMPSSRRSTSSAGRIVRRGVPAHPGSMLWLARLGDARRSWACRRAARTRRRPPRTSCCRGSWPASRASRATIARLGHGGILTRAMRFRFPSYARDLDAPEG